MPTIPYKGFGKLCMILNVFPLKCKAGNIKRGYCEHTSASFSKSKSKILFLVLNTLSQSWWGVDVSEEFLISHMKRKCGGDIQQYEVFSY